MKTLEEIKKLAQQFSADYRSQFSMIGNALTVGAGIDEETGENCLYVYLENDNLSGKIPHIYHEVKVKTQIVGPITAL